MAGLTDDDRSQILLVTGLALAAAFIAIALILNSAIYAQNLASRGGPSENAVTAFQSEVRDGTGEIVSNVNRFNNSTAYGPMSDKVNGSVRDLNNVTARQRAANGRLTNVSVQSWVEGTRVVQNDSRAFVSEGPTNTERNWTVGEMSSGVREFQINATSEVTQTDECSPNSGAVGDRRECFHVNVTDRGTTPNNWTMFVRKENNAPPDDRIVVDIYNGSGTFTCNSGQNDDVVIDLTAGTVAGEECPHLRFAENQDPDYEVVFMHARQDSGDLNIRGNYSFIAASEVTAYTGASAQHNDTLSPASPFVRRAVYSVDIGVRYRTENIQYESKLTVAPGESDA